MRESHTRKSQPNIEMLQMKNPTHVYIVDSYHKDSLREDLENLGLVFRKTYYITQGSTADMIFFLPHFLKAERLLVFMSSISGNVPPAVELSKRIKSENPHATIVFRSHEFSEDSIFDRIIEKDYDCSTTLGIIKDFLNKD